MKKYVKLVMVMGLALLAQTTAVLASSDEMGEKESLKVAMPEISIVQENFSKTTEGAISIGGGLQSERIEIPQAYQEKNVGYMELEGVMS